MTRLNLVLLLAVLASALYLVNVQYDSRRLFTELETIGRAPNGKVDYKRLKGEAAEALGITG